ncbi:MAG: hypothetical protein DRN04_13410 [Thermoprotei archaeon]|nr:MAG: hypothetical protein DRN04_13410 [Thermoprotei archaeon]
MKIGVFTTEIVRKIYGKSLDEAGSMLKDYVEKAFKILDELELNCTEFCIKLSTLEKLCRVTRELDRFDLLLHEPSECSAANLSYLDSEERKHVLENLKSVIDYASVGGFRVITIHPASYNPGEPGYAYADVHYKYFEPKKAWETSIVYLKYLANYASKKGVLLGLENMPKAIYVNGEFLKTPHFGKGRDELLRILSSVDNSYLKITFDTGHANTVCQPADYAEGIVDKIVHIHAHDNDGTCDQHAPLGSGTVDFPRFFKLLVENNYENSLVIERVFDDNILKDIEKIKYWLKYSAKL